MFLRFWHSGASLVPVPFVDDHPSVFHVLALVLGTTKHMSNVFHKFVVNHSESIVKYSDSVLN